MNGIVTNIQRYSLNDGGGIRTTVFLKGCPLRCEWCSNPETQDKKQTVIFKEKECMGCRICADVCPANRYFNECGGGPCVFCLKCVDECPKGALELIGKEMSVEEVLEEVKKDIPFYKNTSGGMTVSGGEALFQPEFTKELLKSAKKIEINTAIETCGYADKETVLEIAEYCDRILYDIKVLNDEIHKKYTGVSNRIILENLAALSEKYADRIVIRVPLIEGINADDENIKGTVKIAKELNIKEIDLLPYHEFGKSKYDKLKREYKFEGKTPEDARVDELKAIIENAGIKCVVGG